MSVKAVHANLHKDLPLSGSRPAEGSNCFMRRRRRRNLECARRSQQYRHSFLTISDNVLNVGGWAGGEKQASRYQPQSGGLPEGAGGSKKWRGGELCQGSPAVAGALQKIY